MTKELFLNFLRQRGLNPSFCLRDRVINSVFISVKKEAKPTSFVRSLSTLRRWSNLGELLPSFYIEIDMDAQCAHIYDYNDYIDAISFKEQVKPATPITLNLNDPLLIELFTTHSPLKVHVTPDNVVALSKIFFQNSNGTKNEFFDELRNPAVLNEYILPYQGTLETFHLQMDELNNRVNQKQLGAFYTPELYVRKSYELLRQAIARVPKGNDYIILDRCAGTGNLEKYLNDEELSHVIFSTYEKNEYEVLVNLFAGKVRYIVPPTNTISIDENINVAVDALSEQFLNDEVINSYLNDPNTNFIIFENPPYGANSSRELYLLGGVKNGANWKNSYLFSLFKNKFSGSILTDMLNLFVWSAFDIYMQKEHDSAIIFAPIKYFKLNDLDYKKAIKGFGFNRKHFNATQGFVGCVLWYNTPDKFKELEVEVWDIVSPAPRKKLYELKYLQNFIIKKLPPQGPIPYYGIKDYSTPSEDYVNFIGTYLTLEEKSKLISTPKFNKNFYDPDILAHNNNDTYFYTSNFKMSNGIYRLKQVYNTGVFFR